MSSDERLQRLLRLVSLLQSGRYFNSEQLATNCKVSRRTIFRDLNTLKKSGIEVRFDESRQGYSLLEGSLLPPADFTLEEALSLLVLCDHLGEQTAGIPFQSSAQTAAVKLLSTLPHHLREYIGELTNSIVVRMEPRNPLTDSRSIYELLMEAVGKRKRIRVTYQSFAEADEITTLLSPYRILFLRRSWYLIGRSSLHREIRTFNIGRIEHAELTEEDYTIPQRFNLERYLGNAWQLIRDPDKRSYLVKVRFAKLVAANVAEIQWHKTQKLVWNDDGTLDFQVKVDSLREIIWWILGYGNQAEVLEPPELREQVKRHLFDMLEMYQ